MLTKAVFIYSNPDLVLKKHL